MNTNPANCERGRGSERKNRVRRETQREAEDKAITWKTKGNATRKQDTSGRNNIS